MTLTVKITDDWLPLPTTLLRQLDWQEGDLIELEIVDQTIIATRIETATPLKEKKK